MQAKHLAVAGRIFGIESVRSRQLGKGNVLRLKVNFLPEVITLAKEVCMYVTQVCSVFAVSLLL